MIECEIWAAARLVVLQHGDDAVIRATQRADKLLAEGNIDGWRIWLRIKAAIERLQSITPDGAAR